MLKIAVLNKADAYQAKAVQLAEMLSLPLIDSGEDVFTHLLEFSEGRLQLRAFRKDAPGAIHVDFLEGPLALRAKKSGIKSEAVARATGLKNHPHPRLLDATAGLGRDAFILAHLGCDVTMLESCPVVAALLRDALLRAEGHDVVRRMSFIETDAIAYMQSCPDEFDVVYLDPMFPAKTKKALVKKEMQLLQEVVVEPSDSEALFEAAFACAQRRVVVKRARLSQSLASKAPSFSVEGKSNRFDIYLKG